MCPSDQELAALLEGSLTPAQVREIHAHADGCASCRRALVQLVKQLPERDRLEGPTESSPPPEPDSPSAPPLAAPAPGDVLGRYHILRLLGRGGMGSVHAAYDPELDRRVALKVIRVVHNVQGGRKAMELRLLREAQAMARLAHPNVVAVHDVGTLAGRVFMAMEYVEGSTLRAWLQEKPRSWQEIRRVFVQAGRGLAAAHAVGLVHRDFKPDNVLLGQDGRVRVADFGLARGGSGGSGGGGGSGASPEVHDEPSPAPGDPAASLKEPLTQEGVVIGTPRYMPPEQIRAEPLDARADQFSFAVALYEALYGTHPFPANRLKDRLAEIERRQIAPPPPGHGVPDWMGAALRRALSADREQRYPTMEALLDALEADARRSRWGARGAAIAAAAALATSGALWALQPDRRCQGGEARLAGIWDGPRRAALGKALGATGGGAPGLRRTEEALDAYARDWVAMQHDACAAARIRKDQTEQVLELRMACLDRRLQELGYLVSALAAGDAKVSDRAVDAALGLPPIRACAEVEALQQRAPSSPDPAIRARAAALSEGLAEVNALRLAGQYVPALQKAGASVEQARALGDRRLEAEALYLQGMLLERTGDGQRAWKTLQEATYSAEVARDDRLRLEIASRMVFTAAELSRFDEGRHWAATGLALLERSGRDAQQEGVLLNNRGTLALTEGRPEEALEDHERAAGLLSAQLGAEHPLTLNALANMAAAQSSLGRPEQALKTLESVSAAITRLRGPDHPTLGNALWSMAHAQNQLGRYAEAHRTVARALEIARTRLGPDHPRVAVCLDMQATVFQSEGRYGEALAAYRESLDIKRKALAPGDPRLFYSHDGIGQSLLHLGRPAEAVPPLEAALALGGVEASDRAEARFALARALWQLDRDRPRALALGKQALRDLTAAGLADRARQVEAWLSAR
jgi:tetratricopeptide (TPR) repeat protein